MAWILLCDVTFVYLLNLILCHSGSPLLYTNQISLMYTKDNKHDWLLFFEKPAYKFSP